MKKLAAFLVVQTLCCGIGVADNPRWKIFGTPIPQRLDLNIHWQATNELPAKVWVYRLLPNRFAVDVVSNLTALCLFTQKDKRESNPDGITFQSSDGLRKLSISFTSGSIHYDTPEPEFGPDKLAVGVPDKNRIPELATDCLRKLHLNLSDMVGYFGTNRFEVSEPRMTMFSIGGQNVTNIPYRTMYFRRAVDGLPISGGDGGSIYFGERGRIGKISISWHGLERIKAFQTYSSEMVVRLFREGKAFQGLVPGTISGVNWSTVKGVGIKSARPCYCSGKSDLLYPFLALTAAIETEEGKIDMEIDSPIVDEALPLMDRNQR